MLKLKQSVIIVVAAVAILTTVMGYTEKDIVEPACVTAEPIIIEPVIEEVKTFDLDLSDVYNEIVNNDYFQIIHVKSMKLDGMYIELTTASMEFNNMTGDCHTSIITENYNADMWNNIDTGKGYITVDSHVTDAMINWVYIDDSFSYITDDLFYSVTYGDLMSTIEGLLLEVDCFDEEYITDSLNWKVSRVCDSGNTTVSRKGSVITITISNPDGFDKSVYTVKLDKVYTDVPEICTQLTSTSKELKAVYKEIKEY